MSQLLELIAAHYNAAWSLDILIELQIPANHGTKINQPACNALAIGSLKMDSVSSHNHAQNIMKLMAVVSLASKDSNLKMAHVLFPKKKNPKKYYLVSPCFTAPANDLDSLNQLF